MTDVNFCFVFLLSLVYLHNFANDLRADELMRHEVVGGIGDSFGVLHFGVPHSDGLIGRGARHQIDVDEQQRDDLSAVTAQCLQALKRVQVPHLELAVGRAARQHHRLRREELECRHRTRVTQECVHTTIVGHVPQLDARVFGPGGQEGLARRRRPAKGAHRQHCVLVLADH